MLLTISGPSAVGKDSGWVRLAESLGFVREVPFTTRAIRDGEVEGRDYHFISTNKFQDMIKNDLLTEWDYTLNAYYGTALSLKNRLEQHDNVVIQVLGRMALRLKRQLPDVQTVMLLTSDETTYIERLKTRGCQGKELEARIAHREEELIHADLFDFKIPDADIMPDNKIMYRLSEIVIGKRG